MSNLSFLCSSLSPGERCWGSGGSAPLCWCWVAILQQIRGGEIVCAQVIGAASPPSPSAAHPPHPQHADTRCPFPRLTHTRPPTARQGAADSLRASCVTTLLFWQPEPAYFLPVDVTGALSHTVDEPQSPFRGGVVSNGTSLSGSVCHANHSNGLGGVC